MIWLFLGVLITCRGMLVISNLLGWGWCFTCKRNCKLKDELSKWNCTWLAKQATFFICVLFSNNIHLSYVERSAVVPLLLSNSSLCSRSTTCVKFRMVGASDIADYCSLAWGLQSFCTVRSQCLLLAKVLMFWRKFLFMTRVVLQRSDVERSLRDQITTPGADPC